MSHLLENSSAGACLQQMRELPFAALDEIAPGSSLILAPHPDDESLGCGGLIASLCAARRPPVVMCITDGAASHPGSACYPPPDLRILRGDEMRAACRILGLHDANIRFLGLPDAQLASSGPDFANACAAITKIAEQHNAQSIFATWRHDPHCDHQAVAAMAAAVGRQTGIRVRYYPVWGWLLAADAELSAGKPEGVRLDISERMDAKRKAIAAHASQYTGLITDSPNGFRLPAALLSAFEAPYEVFLS